jgi:5-methylcytosine-specific restriction endonuclease McrA
MATRGGQPGNRNAAGHTWTNEERALIGDRTRGVAKPPEHRAKIAAALRGREVSAETRTKIGQRNRERPPVSEETRTKLQRSPGYRPVIGVCIYCGAPAVALDHVIPRGRPGADDPTNLSPACDSCNLSKRQHTPDEWRRNLEGRIAVNERRLLYLRSKLAAVSNYMDKERS